MQELADVEDAATEAAFQAAQAGDQVPPSVTKAQPLVIQEPPAFPIPVDDTPTEPATSPRHADPGVRAWPVDLQLPTREYGPHPEPERYATRFVMNDGTEKHKKKLKEPIESVLKAWQIGEPVSMLWVSKHIQPCTSRSTSEGCFLYASSSICP